ncbi:MAG: ABC transporter ATP-binding protein/permease [Candidatus Moeniiplasma glomeromycotorum]|nr:ABC transporter ATP-binding protein/permease [Candidatus Moeniiplasma glomeromycotorum]MCE8167680.1 ABC transporter ATP-binding protein/permease [Candidatus Moeniiplasma glomeromycotorum]MCE8169229.1 ABC transporter ATP-binding protein/permease [Candidatus Moeniiplasma glomeromycotorum]
MEPKNPPQPPKLNWFTITKKYWIEQVVFYYLTTISFLGSWFISQNALKFAWDLINKGSYSKNIAYKLEFFGKTLYEFGEGREFMKPFLITMAILTILYCLIVVIHVYYAYHLANKIIRVVKKRTLTKFFQLRQNYPQKEALNIITNDTRTFSDYVLYVPNQLYYMALEIIFAFVGLFLSLKKKGTTQTKGSVLWLGIIYLLMVIILTLVFNFFLYLKDLLFQKQLTKQTKQENLIINQRDLIIKKNLISSASQEYKNILTKTKSLANQEDFVYTLAFVVPSYSLIKYSKFFFFPFITDKKSFVAFNVLTELFEAGKKMIERLRGYPYYFSAQKRLNNFLQLPERDDIQKNILISEPISTIDLKKVSFGYEKTKPVLKKLDWEFKKGKLNHLMGENGFGKSTIISLIMGLYQPHKGEIVVNNNYKLSEVNLLQWREKIAYAEHENLIENGLSTGQKQLADLDNLLVNSEKKEVFVFDEADNALDENNQKKFRQKIEKISQKKIVILISH